MKHLILPALVLLGVLAWALTRGGEFDYLGAREELLTAGPVVVETSPELTRWFVFPDGQWTWQATGPAASAEQVAGFDGSRYRRAQAPGCYVEDSPYPGDVPGVTAVTSLDGVDHAYDRGSKLLTYTETFEQSDVPLSVTEDLSALADGGGITLTARDDEPAISFAWSLRRATEDEAAAAMAVLDAPLSEVAEILVSERDRSSLAPPQGRRWRIALGCPEVMTWGPGGGWFDVLQIGLSPGPGEVLIIDDAAAMTVSISAPFLVLTENVESAGDGPVVLGEGALFAVRSPTGAWERVMEVLDCPEVAWLRCGPPVTVDFDYVAARDALVAGAVVVDLAFERDGEPRQRYTRLADGRWLLDPLDPSWPDQDLFDGQRTLRRMAEGCYLELGPPGRILDIPGISFAVSLDTQVGTERSLAATTYAYEVPTPDGLQMTVTEDLAALEHGGGITATVRSVASRQTFVIRAASADDVTRASEVIAAARPSESAGIQLRTWYFDSPNAPGFGGYSVLRDCPERVWGGGSDPEFSLGGDPTSFVENVVVLDLPFDAPREELRAAAEEGTPVDAPLRLGLVFATGNRVFEIADCERTEWFACGE